MLPDGRSARPVPTPEPGSTFRAATCRCPWPSPRKVGERGRSERSAQFEREERAPTQARRAVCSGIHAVVAPVGRSRRCACTGASAADSTRRLELRSRRRSPTPTMPLPCDCRSLGSALTATLGAVSDADRFVTKQMTSARMSATLRVRRSRSTYGKRPPPTPPQRRQRWRTPQATWPRARCANWEPSSHQRASSVPYNPIGARRRERRANGSRFKSAADCVVHRGALRADHLQRRMRRGLRLRHGRTPMERSTCPPAPQPPAALHARSTSWGPIGSSMRPAAFALQYAPLSAGACRASSRCSPRMRASMMPEGPRLRLRQGALQADAIDGTRRAAGTACCASLYEANSATQPELLAHGTHICISAYSLIDLEAVHTVAWRVELRRR